MAGPSIRQQRALRVAHLTDVHLYSGRASGMGLAACLRHLQSQADPAELILGGGDLIMDSFGKTADDTLEQWQLWQSILRQENSLPFESCIGNHDVWGWNKTKSAARGDEVRYGKQWAMEMLGLSSSYRSFMRGGWQFIVLDSTHPGLQPDTYTARLDEAQFDWLAQTLAASDRNTPVCVLSHIPILSAAAFFDGDNEDSGNWQVPGAWMHIDARRIKNLFLQHPQVKLCLSGHLHLVDRVDYNGVSYLCNGAVCGGWWKGDYQECTPGYALLDLYPNGSFAHQYVSFGWRS
jgi:3',5'-cyclic AMP phosphodiesterase CpdA